MKRSKLFAMAMLVLAASFTACKKDSEEGNDDQPKDVVVLQGKITTKMVLDANKIYLLKGFVQVMGNGGNLEIPAGTVIKGEKSSKGALIVERGGYIKANGTATNPIIFTSDQPEESRREGDWAGVVICGKSRVNTATGTAQYEGGALGVDVAEYGGTDLADKSGEFTYVRIEFSGYPIQTDKEINGLTLCGVGSGTILHHIQVSYCADDSFEFFGGTVNASHLVTFRGLDDDFDFDQGYTGKIQYAISFRDPNLADKSISRGIEADNGGTVNRDEYSRPVLSNFTIIGSGANGVANHGAGVYFGRNTRLVLANSIIVGAKTNAIEFNTEFPAAEYKAGRSILSDNLVFGAGANYGLITGVTSFADATALATFAATGVNTPIANVDAAGFNSTSITAPNLTLKTGSVALGRASFAGADLSTGFTAETFVGAMSSTDWTANWASWNPKANKY